MRPSQALRQHRDAVCLTVARYRVANSQVFGSTLREDDRDGSDRGGLQAELQELLGVSVDVLTLKDLPVKFSDIVAKEVRPL